MPKLGLWLVVLRGAVQCGAMQRPHVRCFIMPKLGLWFVVPCLAPRGMGPTSSRSMFHNA